MNILKLRLLPLVSLALLPLSAMASSVWQMWDNTSPYACNLSSGTSTSIGNSYSCSGTAGSDPSMAVQAWSTTGSNMGSGTTYAQASVQRWNWSYNTSGTTNDTPFNTAGQTSGYDYGVVNALESGTSPNHSMDNNGQTDMLALNFTQQVALTSASIGWYQTDADISILRYTGNDTPVISGKSISQLMASGWELVGHYANLQNDTTTPIRTVDIVGASSSSWWLVSAFNASYGNGTTEHGGVVYGGCGSGLTCGDDYVKLLQVAGNVSPPDNKTPEPGSMVLLGAGLIGMMSLRRRRQIK